MSTLGNGGKRSRRRSDLPQNAEINVTSLVDVAFTLLVIFIIAAPALQGGVDVAVPKADVQALSAADHPFYVSVTPDGMVHIGKNTVVSAEQFEKSFPQMATAGNFKKVYIRADSMAYWGPVLKVIATVTKAGVKFGMVGEPYQGER